MVFSPQMQVPKLHVRMLGNSSRMMPREVSVALPLCGLTAVGDFISENRPGLTQLNLPALSHSLPFDN